ncbi:MAG: tetratricopeptide repeat protein [Bacteroidota bacterium]|nr:tetratricopeptide repeat protein [Bacteroidota bacterium]MDP4234762.1 tetratricopeptide repeat protein [Bacteroidota bacterium]MDP4244153.1 tetratricopeptide repeat protein [Bacteroidota bacterium]MDP4289315.1 tetratricopeptide repeat protein [Bacteroidota bacterium]
MTRLAALQQFLKQDPNDSFTRYAIGLEYAKEKNFAEAIRTLEELRSLDANYIPTYYMLGSYYRELGQNEQAGLVYRDGIAKARAARDLHAASELDAALDELESE